MNDIQQLLRQQAIWQKARQHLSWPEKVRMVEKVREDVIALRIVRKPTGHPRRAPA